jgi:hypothetical protein
MGLGAGAELTLQIAIGRKLGLEIAYRQVHLTVAGRPGFRDLLDIERFATARLTGTL